MFCIYDSLNTISNIFRNLEVSYNSLYLIFYRFFADPEATVIAVGITNRVNQAQLRQIASDTQLIFNVREFSGLQTIVRNVIRRACEVVTDTPLTGPPIKPLPTFAPVRGENSMIPYFTSTISFNQIPL